MQSGLYIRNASAGKEHRPVLSPLPPSRNQLKRRDNAGIDRSIPLPQPATYFQRYEQKYVLNSSQYYALLDVLDGFACRDEYGLSTIYSIYYDTGDYQLTRKLLNNPVYKEKLRLRSYGVPYHDDTVYVELKKKFKGITYKQRVPVPFTNVEECVGYTLNHSGNYISNEINWFLRYYQPEPKFMVWYDRLAFRGIENTLLRITFDTNLYWRDSGIDFSNNYGGFPLLDKDEYLMEVKVANSIPLYLSNHFARLKIFPVSFSKYRKTYESFKAAIQGSVKAANGETY
jgi:hypothetical protein